VRRRPAATRIRRAPGATRRWLRAGGLRRAAHSSLRWWRRSPPTLRFIATFVLLATLALTANGIYQVVRKPSELFFPVSGALFKTPEETWHDYSAAFRRYATANVSAQLLAALAQVEASGNPLARTYWRWSWSLRPFDFYRPATSAVGMYQITDGTFAEARHYCIRDHMLRHDGPWNDWHACWLNGAYLRIVPADAVELTAAYLELKTGEILARVPGRGAGAHERQHLAAMVHLCGAGAAAGYARRGFRLLPAQRCGDQDPRVYLRRVDALTEVFAGLAARDAATASGSQ
jgi:hypothetical protein